MKNKDTAVKKYRSFGYNFKIAVVVLLFFLVAMRLILILYFPNINIMPDKVLLFTLLFIVSYLWIREVRDYYNLLAINRDLEAAHEQLEQAEINAIASLIKTEEENDLYTRGHSERVTEIALAIAEEMNLDEEAKKIIARAGVLHDIGKIGISDAILHKIEKLTDAEWEVIKSHPEKAVKILEPLRFLSTEINVVLSHHERYDGKGYPRGLAGANIPREALILAVADTFDAMNSNRAYREALSKETILSELNRARDKQLFAETVDIFLKLLEKNPQLWRR